MTVENVNAGDKNYPPLLKEIQKPPSRIYLRGILPEPQSPTVAVVGTRKATKDGRGLAKETTLLLAQAGVVVVSGLAMGIDTAAHEGALDAGGITVAVLGSGIDSVYPAQNQKLAEKIIANGGAVISEYGPGEPSYKGNFIERNRIISGLSLGTVVIEAPEHSGALTTARFAGEDGRAVFVFPGPAKSPHYVGSHALLRDGATLVTSASEILEDLDIQSGSSVPQINLDDFGADEHTVLEALRTAGAAINVDRIIELTKLDPQIVNQALATLAIWRVVQETESGYEVSN